MPTYEYICNACGHEFEKFQSIKAAPIKDCPTCKKKKVERKISVGAGFIFKGSGFYETDYRGEAYKKAAEADKAPSADAKPGDSKSGDAKPAEAKAESKPTDAKPAETKPETKAASEPKPAKSTSKAKK